MNAGIAVTTGDLVIALNSDAVIGRAVPARLLEATFVETDRIGFLAIPVFEAALCAGRLTPQKGVDVIIRAMPLVLKALPNAQLDIVGQGPDRTRLERLAWSLKLATHVRFHGYLPGLARDELAARAWVAVCPSAFEGWGVSCVEAGARGLPVIASNVNGLRDSVRDGITGLLVPHGDHRALADALVDLLGDTERRAEMSAAGIEWAAAHSWERSTNELRLVLAGAIDVARQTESLVTAPKSSPATDGEPVEEVQISNVG